MSMTYEEIMAVAEERRRIARSTFANITTTKQAIEEEIITAVEAALRGELPARWQQTYERMQMTPAERAAREMAILEVGGHKALARERRR